MERRATGYLVQWKLRNDRKPLIIRGARQVGKTYLVEEFAKTQFEGLVKIDFETMPEYKTVFNNTQASQIIDELSLLTQKPIIPQKTLLFFDEIQACPKAISALRFFYEQCPTLHVVAAGSLLDFTLNEFPHSMPVGRVEFCYLNPLTFEEFLTAMGQSEMVQFLSDYQLSKPLGKAIHIQLCQLLRKYFFVGGMPEAVSHFINKADPISIQRILRSILDSMEADFYKYSRQAQADHLKTLLNYIPRNIGQKIKYTAINRDIKSYELKKALHLLQQARLIHLVYHSSCNGIPLGADIDEKILKPIFLDSGLCNQACGLGPVPLENYLTINEGALAEQFVGQQLLNLSEVFEDRKLYYWMRQSKNSNAEIDYAINVNENIYPIEVKAGKTGTLKSLQVFLAEKKLPLGIRFNLDTPSIGDFSTKVKIGDKQSNLNYKLLSLPLYLAQQVRRIVQSKREEI